jgi:hypothetical protein
VDPLGRLVRRDAAVEPEVPAVDAADDVVAGHRAVGEQRAAVRAPALEDVDGVAAPDDDEVDAVDLRVRRDVVDEVAEPGDGDLDRCRHVTLPRGGVTDGDRRWCSPAAVPLQPPARGDRS